MGDKRTIAAWGFASALLLTGCSLTDGTTAAGQDAANQADKLGTRLAGSRLFTAAELSSAAAGTPGVTVRRVTGADSRSTGVRMVIEVTGTYPASASEVTTVNDCFELTFTNHSTDGRASQVSCQANPPESLPAPPVHAQMPANIDTMIQNALPVVPASGTITDADVAKVRSAVAAWHLTDGIHSQVTMTHNAIGVAVRTDDECDMGRAAAGSTKVWHVPPVEYQPGELLCSADEAAYGEGQTPPH